MKTYYLTKDFIKNELGINNVTTHDSPVIVINNMPCVAKMFKWESIEECKNDPMINDIKATDGVISIVEMDYIKTQDIFKEAEGNNIIVDDFQDADKFIARIFVTKEER